MIGEFGSIIFYCRNLVSFPGKTKYIVVDCGGGTVDLTVHELDNDTGVLRELHKGTGGPCGATGKISF